MPLSGFLRTANAASWALALEGYHTVHYVATLLCRLADAYLPHLLARWMRCVLRRRRMLVRIAAGLCIGERVPSVPFHRNRRACKCFKFEGVPYASLQEDDRFGPPLPLPEDKRKEGPVTVLNRPRFCNLGFRFASAAALAPQTPGLLTIDTPVFALALQGWLSKHLRGYSGDAANALQLNLWVPATHFDGTTREQRKQHRYPVLVFFHGGAFVFGSCHQTIANGQALCERGECIVVSCNYRLGILGYLNVPGATCQNRGLRDQVAALEWVKKNIATFGGDPHNVTVSGQSAGSMSVGALLGVEATYREKLFHKALMISGCPQYLPTRAQSEELFQLCLEISEEPSADDLVRALQTMPLRKLIALQHRVERANGRAYRTYKSSLILPFQPFIEGVVAATPATSSGSSSNRCCGTQMPNILPYHPIEFLRHRRRHRQKTIPLLIGSTREEYTFFTRAFVKMFPIHEPCVQSRVRQWVHGAFGVPLETPAGDDSRVEEEEEVGAFAKAVELVYNTGDMSRRTGGPHATFTAINGDFLFRLPLEFLANVLTGTEDNRGSPIKTSKATTGVMEEVVPRVDTPDEEIEPLEEEIESSRGHVWVYRFDRPSIMSSMGATHALDLHYFFNSWWCPPYYTGGWSRAVARLSDTITSDLLAFMRSKTVSPDTLPWPQWNPTTRPQKLYGCPESAACTIAEGCDPDETTVWGDVFERMLAARKEASPVAPR